MELEQVVRSYHKQTSFREATIIASKSGLLNWACVVRVPLEIIEINRLTANNVILIDKLYSMLE